MDRAPSTPPTKAASDRSGATDGRTPGSAGTTAAMLTAFGHHLRTPLTSLLGMIELLDGTELSEEQAQCLEALRSSGAGLHRVLANFIEYAQLRSAPPRMHSAPCDVTALVRSVLASPGKSAREKGVRLVEATSLEAGRVDLDGELLGRALSQLLDNAVRFTPRGEILVAAHLEDVGVLALEVWDTGLGIAPDRLAGLPPEDADFGTVRTGALRGAGLGLVIARHLTTVLGGRLRLRSEQGLGTRAVLEVPVAPGAAPTSDPPTAGDALVIDPDARRRHRLRGLLDLADWRVVEFSSVAHAADLLRGDGNALDLAVAGDDDVAAALHREQGWCGAPVLVAPGDAGGVTPVWLRRVLGELQDGPDDALQAAASRRPERGRTRVLLVEDNEINQRVASHFLQALGCDIELAMDGAEAVALFSPGRYDVVFMDIQMPLMDGYEATHAIREAEGSGSRTPIIALTANAMPGDRELCFDAGMDDYLSKPLQPALLEAALTRALASR